MPVVKNCFKFFVSHTTTINYFPRRKLHNSDIKIQKKMY